MLEDKWLAKEQSRDIAVYLVWSAQLGAHERNVAEAATLMADSRVTHFWDGDEVVGTAFQRVFDVSAPAWDVWMLFPRDATWDAEAPNPAWWEHQGNVREDRKLDGNRFAAKAKRLLLPAPAGLGPVMPPGSGVTGREAQGPSGNDSPYGLERSA